ncbi:retrovirus-related Pol polyprotein from transposon 297 [Trichonephila clavata]|uniref:Retrovirus-related Pol polyprotein from transposon 297 n=1 Tax=Trichonephila clavata TaxID=2740835 RepID=A0A8X6J3R0_TRICU|nr:retrovirus-related Pol polyprotein from transposon 297 [Trichonephila clavata]
MLKKLSPEPLQLLAANNSKILTYGSKLLNIDLGLRRKFSWKFLIASVPIPIIGADFLENFGLLVDLKRRKLIDSVTALSISGISAATDIISVKLISGHLVTKDGIKPLPDKVDPILNYPKTIKELRRFLGLLNFFRRFLPRAAHNQTHLNDFLKGSKRNDNRNINWSEQAKSEFQNYKALLANATLLVHPNPNANLVLQVDASDLAIGGALFQTEDEHLQPLAFFSRKLSETEKGYSAYDRELLAAYASIKQFRHFLSKKEIMWRTKLSINLAVWALFSSAVGVWDVFMTGVSYDDLVQMNAQCDPFDNCQNPRVNHQLNGYNCDCDSLCVEFDSCCIDSPHRNSNWPPRTDVTCRKVYGYNNPDVYMMYSCKNRNFPPEILCGSSAEESNDLFLVIPVTSLTTGITYRNYFCAVCNEDIEADQLVLWNLEVQGHSTRLQSSSIPNLMYDASINSWRIVGDFPVRISIKMPHRLTHIVKPCTADLISNCSKHWQDVSVAEICAEYMAKILFEEYRDQFVWYRNPHCAVCNFKKIERRKCQKSEAFSASSKPMVGKDSFVHDVKKVFESWDVSGILFLKLFQLQDKDEICDRKMIYDIFSKKC